MTRQLDGARLKIVRAQGHLDDLKVRIREYLDEPPYTVSPYVTGTGPVTRTIKVHKSPPDEWSTIVGDCVTNARAALDYIAWELAGSYFSNPPRSIDDRNWLSFPISKNPYSATPTPDAQGYVNRINRLSNRGVPPDILSKIMTVQPHNAGYEPLWWLHELVNTDKHRTLLLTTARLGDVSISFKESTFVECSFVSSRGVNSVSLSNTQAETITLKTDPVEMDVQASVHVFLKDIRTPGERIEIALEQIVKTVGNVVTKFDGFFA